MVCGGKSSRMGVAKLALPFGGETMLNRAVRVLAGALTPIVVVAAPEQELPELPSYVEVVRDRAEGRGPLEGIAGGLRALQGKCTAAYISSCDVPLLKPDFVCRLTSLIGDHDVVVPKDGKFFHPLAAVYRIGVLEQVEDLLANDQLRPFFLFQRVSTREIDVEVLREVDPNLDSLRNLNRPQDYYDALTSAGLSIPDGLDLPS